MDMKLEVVVVPVSDVERAKRYYGGLGWRLDADISRDAFRVVQFTPPGSRARSSSERGSPQMTAAHRVSTLSSRTLRQLARNSSRGALT